MSGKRCEEALTELYRYLDRELDHVSAERVRIHLGECGGCLRSFNFEERLKQVIRQRLAEEVPDEFLVRLRTVIAAETAGTV